MFRGSSVPLLERKEEYDYLLCALAAVIKRRWDWGINRGYCIHGRKQAEIKAALLGQLRALYLKCAGYLLRDGPDCTLYLVPCTKYRKSTRLILSGTPRVLSAGRAGLSPRAISFGIPPGSQSFLFQAIHLSLPSANPPPAPYRPFLRLANLHPARRIRRRQEAEVWSSAFSRRTLRNRVTGQVANRTSCSRRAG